MSDDETIVCFGGEVKALGDGRIGGDLVRFSDADTPDLVGDYFDAKTDFDAEFPASATVYFNHGLDPTLKRRKLSRATLTTDEVGVWAETILKQRDDYEKMLYKMAEDGILGWSSGTAGHLVEREQVGKAMYIKTWPLGPDASLTHTPAEPRNNVIPLKSLSVLIPLGATPTGDAEAAATAQREGGADLGQSQQRESNEVTMADNVVIDTEAVATKAAEEALKRYAASLPTTNAAGNDAAVIVDEADKPFQSLGEQLYNVKRATLSQGRDFHPRLKALNLKATGLNELVGSEGAFLLEPTYAGEVLKPMTTTGVFSSMVDRLQIGPNSNSLIINSIDETSRAAGSRWGGVRGYWLGEAGTKTKSKPTFSQLELKLKKIAVLCYATDELLQDQVALANIIRQGASAELDFMVNDAILNGDGAGKPLGVMNSGCLVSVYKEAGQAADTIMTENIFKMWSRLHPASKSNAVWFINPDVTPQLYALNLSVGTGGMPMFMAPRALPNSPSGSLLGRPVVENEYSDTVGDLGDILLGDFSQYAYIDREVQAASSIHVQFVYDESVFRFVYRCDGQPKWASTLTPFQSSNTLSPFVALAARA